MHLMNGNEVFHCIPTPTNGVEVTILNKKSFILSEPKEKMPYLPFLCSTMSNTKQVVKTRKEKFCFFLEQERVDVSPCDHFRLHLLSDNCCF